MADVTVNPPETRCIWPDCDAAATVRYVTHPDPVYCGPHADEMEAADAELGFAGAKVRAE